MKCATFIISMIVILSMALGACSPAPGAAGVDATQPPATEPAVIPDTGATPTTAVVPIDLAGPPMKVGSFYTYVDGAILAAVPGGSFIMGAKLDDNPERQVTLDDFWIYTSEVTHQQYALCVSSGKCTPPDAKDDPNFENYRFVSYPVVGLNYQQAADYCSFVHARLPTDAEWEKAARGEQGNIYPWGNSGPQCELLNFNNCKGKPIDVKSYPDGASFYGLFDMAGNVREWTSDWYQPDYNADGTIQNPLGPELGEKRSVRSSSFSDKADAALAAHRFSLEPDKHLPDLGFRCVVTDINYYAPYCQTQTLYGADVNGNPTNDVIPQPPNCAQPFFTSATNCKTTTDTFITIHPYPLPGGAVPTIPGECSGGPDTYQCTGSGSATIDPESCELPPPPEGGSCPPGYDQQADPQNPDQKICTGKGPGQECAPGFNYDPALQCCSAINPNSGQTSLCPPGYYQVGNVCVPSQSNPPQLQQAVVSWAPVELCPGNDTSGGCDPATDPTCQEGGGCGTYPSCNPGCHADARRRLCLPN